MKGTGAKRNVCPGSCVSTGAKFPVAPVESAPMIGMGAIGTRAPESYKFLKICGFSPPVSRLRCLLTYRRHTDRHAYQ